MNAPLDQENPPPPLRNKPPETLTGEVPLQLGIGLAFCICFLYWNYLFLTCSMLIKFDSIGYQDLGRMVYEKGWIEYFQTGPHREPLYPFLISLSMRLGDLFSVSFLEIQKIFQLLLLFITQLFTLLLLNRMKVRDLYKAIVIIYLGFSPALINASLSLLSEILVMPLILMLIDSGASAWQNLITRRLKPLLINALILSGIFILAIFSKGIFFYIMLMLLGIFMLGGVCLFLKQKRRALLDAGLFCLIVFLIVQSFVVPFKLANQTYNGHYTLTNRYMELLFGNTYKRAKAMDKRKLLAHIASVPGGGVCRAIFTDEECQYCEFQGADYYRMALPGLLNGKTTEQASEGEVLRVVVDQIQKNPWQYLFLTAVESLKMFFWESTQLGFVEYPSGLRRLYDHPLFSNGLRLVVSGLTLLSFFGFAFWVLRKIRFLVLENPLSEEIQTGFFILLLVIMYTGLYALFSIITRYAAVLAPLFLIMIAYAFNHWLGKKSLP